MQRRQAKGSATDSIDGVTQSNSSVPPPKPRLRGWSHFIAAFIAAGVGWELVKSAPNNKAAVATLIYVASLVTLFAVSATYHIITWSPGARRVMRRLDHSSIFLLIAGTYTPICWLAVRAPSDTQLLKLVWAAAAAGIVKTLLWTNSPKALTAVLFVLMGWLCALYRSDFTLSASGIALMGLGGLAYSVGAAVYALKWPNPAPRIFGYHEIFHLLVIVAGALHFAAVAQLVWTA